LQFDLFCRSFGKGGKMKVSLIAALDEERGLGKGNELLWRIPEDLKNFKRLTMGHYVLLGRKTFESIGRPLPGRTLMVLTRKIKDESLSLDPSIITVHSVQEAMDLARKNDEKELMVAGGAQIYEQLIPFAQTLYLTRIKGLKKADAYFPCFESEENPLWVLHNSQDFKEGPSWPSWSYQVFKKV
jgi:dihydrofolate reductase